MEVVHVAPEAEHALAGQACVAHEQYLPRARDPARVRASRFDEMPFVRSSFARPFVLSIDRSSVRLGARVRVG